MKNKTAVFSWFQDQVDKRDETFQLLERHQIDRIYQLFKHDISVESAQYFLKSAQAYKKDVYLLAGEAEWALEKHRQEIGHYIEWAAQFNPLIRGLVLDIEPHTLEEFKANSKIIMKSFTENLQYAYSLAKSYQLKVILCLPYYFDQLGFYAEVETIIAEALDELAIINYYRGKEVEHLRFEAELSLKYNKPIQTIYELQLPGKYGLTNQNTYYNQGLEALYRNYKNLKAAYGSQTISLSLHEFKSFKELTNRKDYGSAESI